MGSLHRTQRFIRDTVLITPNQGINNCKEVIFNAEIATVNIDIGYFLILFHCSAYLK